MRISALTTGENIYFVVQSGPKVVSCYQGKVLVNIMYYWLGRQTVRKKEQQGGVSLAGMLQVLHQRTGEMMRLLKGNYTVLDRGHTVYLVKDTVCSFASVL